MGEKLNDRDVQWFSCWLGKATSGLPHQSVFHVRNGSGEPVEVSLRGAPRRLLHPGETLAEGEHDIYFTDPGDQLVYLLVQRTTPDQGNVHVGWRTALTFAVPPFRLRCDDETGIDVLGADEITVAISADGFTVGEASRNDVDTGESFNVNVPICAGFETQLDVFVTEHETIDDDHGHGHIGWLAADKLEGHGETQFSVGGGSYTFRCELVRALPGT